jgi:hypothetical protein
VSIALDVAIGVVFLYLLLSLIVTTVQELIASLFRLRAKHLLDAVAGMLGDSKSGDGKPLVEAIYTHPLIRNLTPEAPALADGKPSLLGKNLPSYIPSRAFAIALIDVLRQEKTATDALGATRILAQASETIAKLPKGNLKKALELLVGDARSLGANLDDRAKLVSQNIEGWFNDRMARASGWYKRKAQVLSLVIAALVTLAANADSIHVVNRLWNDAALRASVVASAEGFVDTQSQKQEPAAGAGVEEVRQIAERLMRQSNEIETSGLPVGWKWELQSPSSLPCARLEADHRRANGKQSTDERPLCWAPQGRDYVFMVAGWIITMLAVSLGAAFWFDILSKALQLRGSGPRVSVSSGKVDADQS